MSEKRAKFGISLHGIVSQQKKEEEKGGGTGKGKEGKSMRGHI